MSMCYVSVVFVVVVSDGQWELLKTTALAGAAVVGIMNPASGPGTTTDPSYITAIDDVKSSGAQVHTMHAMVAGLPRLGHFCWWFYISFKIRLENISLAQRNKQFHGSAYRGTKTHKSLPVRLHRITFGLPGTLHSDQGTEFDNQLVKELQSVLG